MKRIVFVLVFLFIPVLFVRYASGEAGAPTERIRSILEEVMTIQTDPKLQGREFKNERKIAIKKIIAQNFHFDVMAKGALGPHWGGLSEGKHSEFKTVFQDLFQESYTRMVLDFLGREKIQYVQEESQPGKALVKTIIVRLSEAIPVDYLLLPVGENWLVADVTIDGVSIIQNYQRSFSRVIKQESFDTLMKKMRLQQEAIGKAL
jgi:phospholipid transport system substrate-binding protein